MSRRRVTTAVVAAILTVVLAGCGEEGTDAGSGAATASPTETATDGMTDEMKDGMTHPMDPSPSESMSAPMGHGTEVVAADSEFGTILFDAEQQAIYMFDVETTDEPKCYDGCAEAWPPVLTEADPRAGTGLDKELLGTTARTDGTTQVTYGGHPLYYYAHEGPGEVKCHDVAMNGGNWYVLQPDGERAP